MAKNTTLGRGELWFARFKPGTQIPDGELYFGNTPEFSMTIEAETLDHYDADHGINEKDESINISTNRSGSFSTDNIEPRNVALFFFGSEDVLSVGASTVTDEHVDDVKAGRTYQLGTSNTYPQGRRKLASVVVKDDDTPTPTTFVVGEDYTVDLERGRLTIIDGGDIVDGTNLRVSYSQEAHSRSTVISGSEPVAGALRFISFNATGERFDYFLPYVKVSPNGDYNLKGDEWQVIPFNLEILKKTGLEAIYMDGLPFNP